MSRRSAASLLSRRGFLATAAGGLSAMLGAPFARAVGTTAPRPPIAEIRTSIRTVNGIALIDPYGWLKADNWRAVLDDPQKLPRDIRGHIEAENAYADAWLEPLRPLSPWAGAVLPAGILRRVRSWSRRRSTHRPSADERAMIAAAYEADIVALQELVGRDLSHWRLAATR